MNKKRENEGFSLALLIPLIWFLRAASRGITYWLSPEMGMNSAEFDYLRGSPIDRNFLIVLEFIGLSILLRRRISLWEFIKQNKWIVILYLYMGLSVFWSSFPEVSFKRWVRTIGDLIMVAVVITEFDYSTAAAKLFRLWSYVLVPLSVLFVKYWRHLGVSYDNSGMFEMWIGVTTHKNSLGQLVCISSIFFVWIWLSRMYKKRLLDIAVLLMSLWLLSGSKTATSRTSLVVFLFGVVTLLLLKFLKTNVSTIRVAAIVLVGGFLVGNVLSQHLYSSDLMPWLISATGGDPTLTGRTLLWDELLRIGSHRALLGAGYGGFWIGNIGNQLWEIFTWHPGQAHNGYIDIYIDLGLVGLVLIIILIISIFKNILLNLSFDSDFGRFRMTAFVMILIYNVTESSFAKPTSMLWITFLLIALKVPEAFPEESRINAVSSSKSDSSKLRRPDEVTVV